MRNINYWASLEPNQVYHIYNHAVGTENLFKQPRNYFYFWQQWNKFITPYFANYAYCLMPNHFHVLGKAKKITGVLRQQIREEATKIGLKFLQGELTVNDFYSNQFARFFKSYSNAINRQEINRYGSLFKNKFKRTLVKDKAAFDYYLCYVHHNPIHHGMVTTYLDYEHCSYAAYVDRIAIEGLSIGAVLKSFRTQEDATGLQGFLHRHQWFKDNYPYGQG